MVVKKSTPKKNGFHSTAEATDVLIRALQATVPNTFDCYVGIPRAGLLFANILASSYGRALATPSGFVNREVWYANELGGGKFDSIHSVLVVDDSAISGIQLSNAVSSIKAAFPYLVVKSLAIFKTEGRHCFPIDYVLIKSDSWTLAEWNLLTSLGHVGRLGCDLDGVLCEDCPTELDDDGPRYLTFIRWAKPLFIPKFPIEVIVTSRLEKYREATETWLKENGVKYKSLIMLNLPSKQYRDFNTVVYHKAGHAKVFKLGWFWESDDSQAREIHRQAGVAVLSIEKRAMYGAAK